MENDEDDVLQYFKSKKMGLLCATMLLRRDKRKREELKKKYGERVDGLSLHGDAAYGIVTPYNEKDVPCTKEEFVYLGIDEYSSDGELLHQTPFYEGCVRADDAKFNAYHPVRKWQIEQVKKGNYHCLHPLMGIIDSIREEGAEKGWSDERIEQECEKAHDVQRFLFFRSDKVSQRTAEILETTDNISLTEARVRSEADFKAEENQQKFADEYFADGTLSPEQRLGKWKELNKD